MKNFFSEHRFVFLKAAPERQTAKAPEKLVDALRLRREKAFEKFESTRGRQQLLRAKKKVSGPKFQTKEARVWGRGVQAIRLDGSSDIAAEGDRIRILNRGQRYEIGGHEYVRVHVSKHKGEKRKFYAYIRVSELEQRRSPKEYREAGKAAMAAFKGKVADYLKTKGLDKRLAIVADTDVRGGKTFSVVDKANGDDLVSWSLLDAGMDDGDSNTDTAPRYANEANRGADMVTFVMGGVNRKGRMPRQAERKRLHSEDSMHYNGVDAFVRAKVEIDTYLAKNPVVKSRVDISAGGKKLVKALKREIKNQFPGFDLRIVESNGQVKVIDNKRNDSLAIVQADGGDSYSVSVGENTQHMRLRDVVEWMGGKVIKNMRTTRLTS